MNISIKREKKYILELTEDERIGFHKEQYNGDLEEKPITKAMVRLLENNV